MKSLLVVLFLLLSVAQANADSCPSAVRLVNFCDPYLETQQILSAVDYQAMGEVGPAVAKEVMSVTSIFSLAKSVWTFKPTLSQLRSKYFIPMLRVIDELKTLNTADRSNRAQYLSKTQDVYTDLVLTSLDTTLKTYKVAPGAVSSALKLGFAWTLASASDPTPQPKWVSDLLNKLGLVTSDILFNESKTPLSQRIDRLSSMEDELRNAVAASCRETPSDEDCKSLSSGK